MIGHKATNNAHKPNEQTSRFALFVGFVARILIPRTSSLAFQHPTMLFVIWLMMVVDGVIDE